MAIPGKVDASSTFALDAQALSRLKTQAASDPQRALKSAAQQFEAVFVDMLLKSMRATLPKSGMLDSNETQFYTSMLDSQVAQSMASRGIGLAEVMVRQLQHQSRALGAAQTPSLEGAALVPAALRQAAGDTGATLVAAPTKPNGAAPGLSVPGLFEQARASVGKVIDSFTEKLLPHAVAASQVAKVPAFFMLGQAALETGWGRREIVGPGGEQSYNLFGIKAGKGWTGKVVEATTTEWSKGEAKKVVEKFRAYGSYAEAFADYARLLTENPRYAAVMDQLGEVAGFAQGLQKAGYATDPQYAKKLARTIDTLVNRYGAAG
ncbi:MAG: flagellar assembly peptidoglycan hydrolase FlgJ [Betaproteobacteria bacterium]|nr:flagellar assembly peptidoglycan hydrolase FlgJ [Betaproteobacteria bacterium]